MAKDHLHCFCAEKSSSPVAEQCAWALGNVAGEGEEFRNVLLSQGALPPLARMMLPNKGSTVRTAAWALSNLIKVFISFLIKIIVHTNVYCCSLNHGSTPMVVFLCILPVFFNFCLQHIGGLGSFCVCASLLEYLASANSIYNLTAACLDVGTRS